MKGKVEIPTFVFLPLIEAFEVDMYMNDTRLGSGNVYYFDMYISGTKHYMHQPD